MKHSTLVTSMATAMMLAVTAPGWAEAKQTSLDSRIIKAFENIDGRTNTHEQNMVTMKERLERQAKRLKDLRGKLANIPKVSQDPVIRKRRRILHGQVINASAEFLNQSYKLVDSAAALISANLTDLAKLANAVRQSPDSKKGALQLKRRVQKNIAAGRSMRGALLQLRDWAQKNPGMIGRFQSLKRLTQALDRRVTIDKTRLKSRNVDATGAIRGKRQDALDRTVDRLGDMYAQVQAEKETLKDLRDELSIAIQLGRMEMTQEIAERAIPSIGDFRAPETGIDPLKDLATVIGDLNATMIAEANMPSASSTNTADLPGDAGQPPSLKIGGFSNF
ncbi:MAG: hypothetical protein HOI25_09800 [Proteobacteria bacterium]|nr:hypothetical protein [Pseudomonadota bacterium]